MEQVPLMRGCEGEQVSTGRPTQGYKDAKSLPPQLSLGSLSQLSPGAFCILLQRHSFTDRGREGSKWRHLKGEVKCQRAVEPGPATVFLTPEYSSKESVEFVSVYHTLPPSVCPSHPLPAPHTTFEPLEFFLLS